MSTYRARSISVEADLMVLAVLVAWLLVSVLTAAACAAVVGGGVAEDRRRGFLVDEP